MEKPDRMEWVPTYFCENSSRSLPKESVPALSELVVICELIAFFGSSTQTVLTGVSRVVPEYESSWMMISSQMRTGQRVLAVLHCVNMAFLTPFLCVRNVRDTLSAR